MNVFILFCWICIIHSSATWINREIIISIIENFENLEKVRANIRYKGPDRRPSNPFISGDTFRSNVSHICEDSNRCRMSPKAVANGSCIFVKSDFFNFFATEVIPQIPHSYIVISHNGDLSTPDGQNDAQRIGMHRYVTSDILKNEFEKGRLLAHHGQNLWWVNKTEERPAFSHCLPIGLENRQYRMGGNLQVYIDIMRDIYINTPPKTIMEKSKLPLLLIAFYPKSRVPDRQKVLTILGALPPKGQSKPTNTWYNETDLSHREWLYGIAEHRFVLAPFGHGLDTHRISEILLMGGIPVMRRSSISSCYDDSDNNFRGTTRGSLPVVLLDSWQELTADRLEKEWLRLSQPPIGGWDWRRVFVDHWLERIGCP